MKKRAAHRGIISSWIVIGMSLILVITVSILAAVNYNRQKQGMQRLLSEKGAALIKSFEAGTRTGMMGRFGTGSRLQTLLTETASLEDILYIALVDVNGKILAHNDPDGIGKQFASPEIMRTLAATEKTGWRLVESAGEPASFEVYKKFLPLLANPRQQQRRGIFRNRSRNSEEVFCQPGWMEGLPQDRILDPGQRPVIFIGMDVNPYLEAIEEDFRHTLIMSAIIVLLGLAGVVSLFWAQSYTRSRKLLQDTRAFASEMIANLPEGIIVTGKDDRITFINSIAREMLDLEQQDAHGITPAEILPEKINTLAGEITEKGKIVNQELSLVGAKGTELSITATVTEILSEDGDFVGTMYILHDLTPIKELQEAVRKQEKMAAIGNLAAGVAHEVRNPLSSIKGYATYFGSLFEEGSDKKKAADVMTAEVERLNRVISELLEIARPSDIKPKKTDMSFLLASSLRLIQQEAETEGVQIKTIVPEGIAPLYLDPDRITQALINLYINAIQAMPEGGILTISVAETEANVAISVADTGIGITGDRMNKIFDPYYTTKNTGTGLGLAVVQKVVEAHGGSVEVKSAAAGGTVFIITLPRDER
ncbi:MAG: ATP-binding protein [Desulfobulbaceae bacterium]|nr:ATP-binding protein [Desulfobulbaceae bacterium]